ncbi:hypothetical protein DENSPDRAFT_640301 [Dentipellis sp. KUC8613]|nr:hypothetical protein DENSPDRAFT_640301 [Dentipellis sp. KUC8613]
MLGEERREDVWKEVMEIDCPRSGPFSGDGSQGWAGSMKASHQTRGSATGSALLCPAHTDWPHKFGCSRLSRFNAVVSPVGPITQPFLSSEPPPSCLFRTLRRRNLVPTTPLNRSASSIRLFFRLVSRFLLPLLPLAVLLPPRPSLHSIVEALLSDLHRLHVFAAAPPTDFIFPLSFLIGINTCLFRNPVCPFLLDDPPSISPTFHSIPSRNPSPTDPLFAHSTVLFCKIAVGVLFCENT